MVNTALVQTNTLITKACDVIRELDNSYTLTPYSPEVLIERGKYGFNFLPQSILPREETGINSLVNINIDIFMHYDLEADDKFATAWAKFMIRAEAVLNALYDKTNYPVGVSTVTIGMSFDNPIIEKERIIDLTYNCEYKIFATR